MDEQKICIITGASSGLGYHTALKLASLNSVVVLVCKDEVKGAITRNYIVDQTQNKSVHLYIADLSIQQDIRELVEKINSAFPRVDVLINNAACIYVHHTLNEDGIEMQFAVNHLAPFLLTNLLLDNLKKSDQGRIINVSSRAHARGKIHFDNLNFQKDYTFSKAYNQSKLANIYFTYELARKLKDTSVTVNCMHPGLMNTSIGNKNTTLFYSIIWSLIKTIGNSPEKSSKTIIHLAYSPNMDSTSGKYFANCKIIKSSEQSYNINIAKKLWYISEQLANISFK